MKRTLIAAAVGFAALSAGCSGTAGQAKPDPTGTTPTSGAASGLDSIKPCELLSDTEMKQLGITDAGKPEKLGSADSCSWNISGNGGVHVGVRKDRGVKDLTLEGNKKYEVPVGKFTATKVEGQDGSADTCSIVISVTEGSSVSVVSNLSGGREDTAASCERATKAATLVAAKLP
ncbi:DUF3558 family protein [Lentzea sp. BCCO 10_0856]|uniref:DUF3558 family protein n=1 Tax=Lentzea miocenica TaxID=3095431 RepID=A0ABU4SYN7_9PSEU|nr:DUF3558 family protein [Lentzea sp. BCCO 10_0856]MDX8030955.1 DUF3558 family protein [Lentzea sp. BCCO 10_0856]